MKMPPTLFESGKQRLLELSTGGNIHFGIEFLIKGIERNRLTEEFFECFNSYFIQQNFWKEKGNGNVFDSFVSIINQYNSLLDAGYSESEAEALMKLIL